MSASRQSDTRCVSKMDRGSLKGNLRAFPREGTSGVSFCWLTETRLMTDSDLRDAFHAHKDVLYRFVFRMTGSANGAEDIVQECFLALWRKPDA